MTNTVKACSSILLAAGFLLTGSANAIDFGKMMNPTKWMKSDKSDDYYDDRYGPPPPGYGYGGPGYGGPGYGGPGYGGPGYGYGGPGYGAPGYGGGPYGAPGYGGGPGYDAPGYGGAPAYTAPPMSSGADAAEIARLKERIRVLEDANREIPAPSSSFGGQQGYQQAPAYGGGQPGGYQQAPAYGAQPGFGGQPGYGGQQAPAYGNPNPQFRPPSAP